MSADPKNCFVVTGASSGIGAAVAQRLLARGETVVAVARRAERLAELSGAIPVIADLATDGAAATVADALKARGLVVRGFIHCAGFAAPAPLSLTASETAQRLYAVHTLFPLQFLGWFGKAPNHVAGAAAVLVSSLACHVGEAGNAAYAAAKGAVEGLVRAAAAELAARGVRVNAVAPGVVETEMARATWMDGATPEQVAAVRARYPFGFASAEQIADVILFLVSDAAAAVTGQCLVADCGRSFS